MSGISRQAQLDGHPLLREWMWKMRVNIIEARSANDGPKAYPFSDSLAAYSLIKSSAISSIFESGFEYFPSGDICIGRREEGDSNDGMAVFTLFKGSFFFST